ncbi:MAG: hypothetical protein VW378_07340, partial [bacterium]
MSSNGTLGSELPRPTRPTSPSKPKNVKQTDLQPDPQLHRTASKEMATFVESALTAGSGPAAKIVAQKIVDAAWKYDDLKSQVEASLEQLSDTKRRNELIKTQFTNGKIPDQYTEENQHQLDNLKTSVASEVIFAQMQEYNDLKSQVEASLEQLSDTERRNELIKTQFTNGKIPD